MPHWKEIMVPQEDMNDRTRLGLYMHKLSSVFVSSCRVERPLPYTTVTLVKPRRWPAKENGSSLPG